MISYQRRRTSHCPPLCPTEKRIDCHQPILLHHLMHKHWGLDKLAKKEYEKSIGEMKHADQLIDRIFMPDGLLNLQDMRKFLIGENITKALRCDFKSELVAQNTIKVGIAHCKSVHDFVSRDLLKNILHHSEVHIDFSETQIELISKAGLPNYL